MACALTLVAEKAAVAAAGSLLGGLAGAGCRRGRRAARLGLHTVTDRYFCVQLIDRFFGN